MEATQVLAGGCEPFREDSCSQNETAAGTLEADFIDAVRSHPRLLGASHCQCIDRTIRPGYEGGRSILKQGLLAFDGTPHTVYIDLIRRANRGEG